jgi:hypothetical protein
VTIEGYLAELRQCLRLGPLAKRRILREVDEHLRQAARRDEGEERAIASFGSPAEVAARFARPRRYVPRAAGASLVAVLAVTAIVASVIGIRSPDLTQTQVTRIVRAYCGGVNAKAICVRVNLRYFREHPELLNRYTR